MCPAFGFVQASRRSFLRKAVSGLVFSLPFFMALIAPPPVSADVIVDFNSPGSEGNYTGANFTDAGHPNAQIPPFEAGPDAYSDGEFLRLKEFPASGFYRSFNAVGFDQTDAGLFGRIVLDFDFRITCGGTRVVGSGFDFRCADGFSVGFMNTATFGTTGVPFTLDELGRSSIRNGSFAVGFNTFDNGGETNNSLRLAWNDSSISGYANLGNTFDIVTGSNRVREEFQRAHIDLTLGVAPVVTVQLTDGFGNTVTPFNAFDLSTVLVNGLAVGPYDSRLGFFTRTGDSTESVDIDNVRVQYLNAIGGGDSVPAPGALVLLGFGLLGLCGLRRKQV